ncbi:CAP domain-containing protein [Nucisporomicrobium flavum]|uniref:CAP domain-containing protein n=1 Tax=Nucisporomicrobium flavum TaxID=2785915 RepID=UPI0018F58BF4|nr:CAP domain-containing protein [Nucisporomicrobium flavum]
MFDSVRRIAAAAAPAALLALIATPAHAGTTVPAAAARPTTEQVLMDDVIARTNEERALAGCAPLGVEQELMVASVRQSHYMAATGDFGHIGWRGSTFQTRSRAAGYPYVAGENIAWGFTSPAEVVDAWMASPEHRRNILNCDARSFGAGVQRAANGTLYWTQVFGWR